MTLKEQFIPNKGYLVSLELQNDLYTVYINPGSEEELFWYVYEDLGEALEGFKEAC